jgi:hypothetical protein
MGLNQAKVRSPVSCVSGSTRSIMAAACLALLLFASCSHPQGRVTVGIVYRGGPAPGNSNILRPGTVRIFGADGSLEISGRVTDGATLHTTLHPGTYRFEAHSGDAQCKARVFTVRAGSDVDVRIPCSVM